MLSLKVVLVLVIISFLICLSGCAPGGGSHTSDNPAGFFTGIWHGWIAPLCLILGIFNPSIRVYEAVNTGWWYDFGFYIAIIGGFGSFSLIRKKHKKKK
jgi:hypothetical protein